MKRTEWFILIATAAYSYLFYEQSAGINFLIFSILLVAFCLYSNLNLYRQTAWVAAAAGTVISGFAVFCFGTGLPVYANLVSLALLAAFSYKSSISLFTGLFNFSFSLFWCIPSFLRNFRIFSGGNVEPNTNSRFKKLLLFAMALGVALIFFMLYRASNPLFEKVTNEINLDFISWSWIFFTLVGFLLMCGFFYQRVIKSFTGKDESTPDQLAFVTEEEHQKTPIAAHITPGNELFTGKVLLILLNLVLLSVNSIDIYYLYIQGHLPDGLTEAQYLHDGTNSLIFSIALAISVLLFYFRGRLNFIENNGLLRLVAYAWIVQNIFLVSTTLQRNYFYIGDFGLTHKRIGVYIFLSLCIIGLATTFMKIYFIKSNWFMFRKNTWVWYVTLVLSSLINWDGIIGDYNTKLAVEKSAQLDFLYMTETSYQVLPAMYNYYYSEGFKSKIDSVAFVAMNEKYETLKADMKSTGWQSYCSEKVRVVSEVERFKMKGSK